ncbi:MAG TPA: glutamate--cysteine ligase [Alphaproteobacteria bacterium]
MAVVTQSRATVASRDELVAYIEQGCKPRETWRIGTEHEKIGFHVADLTPIPYEGARGVRAMLDGLTRFGWAPIIEGDHPIALQLDGQRITLEPGGQFELSGAPLETLHQTCGEVNGHLCQVREVAEALGIGFLGIGMQPKWRRDQIPVMPKRRYDIMRAYMPKVGTLGLDMMLRTCTVQANLDFESEADMVRKFRVSLALQPLAIALFANSPFTDGKPNGWLSYRAHVWSDTDPARCGIPGFVFEPGMGFEAYTDFALDVPMYFVRRAGRYIDAAGQSFRDFLAGRLPALPGERPSLSDWEDHLTTIFTDVRLKRYLEMRGADGGPWRMLCALPALWVGLLYDAAAIDAAQAVVADWRPDEIVALRADAARSGLAARIRGRGLREIAREVLEISRRGLSRRACLDRGGADETGFLTFLDGVVESGRTPAEAMLEAYHGRWHESVDPAFTEFAY